MIHAKHIIQHAADLFGRDVSDITGPSRSPTTTLARHVAIYVARRETDMSLNEIAKAVGRTDHMTIASAVKRIDHLVATGDQRVGDAVRIVTDRSRADWKREDAA